MKNKLLLCLQITVILLISLPAKTFSQGEEYIHGNFTPPSPDGLALIRSIQTNPQLSTGVLHVPIHLYDLKSGDIEVPVSINYTASGLKVEDKATTVGLGWHMSAGGKITRMLNGSPDLGVCNANEIDKVDLFHNIFSNYPYGETTGMSFLYTYMFNPTVNQCNINNLNEMIDVVDPDVFFFDIPGKSGLFIIDEVGRGYCMPHQDIYIEWVGKEYFIIRDHGTEYIFGSSTSSREVSSTSYTKEFLLVDVDVEYKNYVSTWHLDKIHTYKGDGVYFQYQTAIADESQLQTKRDVFFSNWNNSVLPDMLKNEYNMKHVVTTTEPKVIKEIISSNQRLAFTYDPDKNKITDIKEYYIPANRLIRTIQLSYIAPSESSAANSLVKHRLLLESLVERTEGSMRRICDFEYHTDLTLPNINESYITDHWGYWNGYDPGKTMGFPAYRDFNPFESIKTPSFEHTRANTLKKILYPTGGETEFIYELNQEPISVLCIGGLRIKKIIKKDSDTEANVTSYEYLKNEFKEIMNEMYRTVRPMPLSMTVPGIELYFTNQYISVNKLGSVSLDMDGHHVVYTKVKETADDGSHTIYEFYSYKDVLIDSEDYCKTYTVNHNPEGWAANFGNSKEKIIVSPGYAGGRRLQTFWGNGLLKSNTQHDASGEIVAKTEYQYNFKSPPRYSVPCCSPIIKNTINDLDGTIDGIHSQYFMFETSFVSQPIYLESVTVQQGRFNQWKKDTFVYDSLHMAPIKIIEHFADGSVVESETKYSFDCAVDDHTVLGNADYPIKLLKDLWINHPLETVIRKNGYVIGGNIDEFRCHDIGNDKAVLNMQNIPVLKSRKKLMLDSPVGSITPSSFDGAHFSCDNRYQDIINYYEYGKKGKLVSYVERNGSPTSIIYRDEDLLPVAIINNAVVTYESGIYKNAVYLNFEGTSNIAHPYAKTGKRVGSGSFNLYIYGFTPGDYTLTYWGNNSLTTKAWTKVEISVTISSSTQAPIVISPSYTYVDEVRLIPKEALMTTYDYEFMFGISSETAANGNTTYYEYDSFGRLCKILDNDRDIMKEYEYHLQSN